jgi:hypothetical protein
MFIERPRFQLALILGTGALLRLFWLLGPHAEIDADEAIVGLMALNIPRELPVFFWEQHYLGSLEAFGAAALFSILGPSAWALKLVPALSSLLFVLFVYLCARRAFGTGPALLAALYLAIPPSFLAVWSVKARGGYAELLAIGQLFLLLCQLLVERNLRSLPLSLLAGLSGGLALWTHPLAVVYLGAGGLYVFMASRQVAPRRSSVAQKCDQEASATADRAVLSTTLMAAFVGFLVGVGPVILYNLSEGFPSLRYASTGGTAPGSALVNLWGLARYGAPVLAGLAEGTASKVLLDQDWPRRPGSNPFLTAGLLFVIAAVLWSHRNALIVLFRGGGKRCAVAAAPFLLVILLVPPVVAVSRFADLWAEPRYALPVYGAIPLFAATAWRLRGRSRPLFFGVLVVVFGVNLMSLITSEPRLSLPTSAGASTRANRAELIDYLLAHNLTRIYTEYWIGYPLAFESGERIIPAVRSGGFDRRQPYGHQVWTTENPSFVFPADALGDREFRRDLAALDGTADVAAVSVYHVYTNVRPLDPLRP